MMSSARASKKQGGKEGGDGGLANDSNAPVSSVTQDVLDKQNSTGTLNQETAQVSECTNRMRPTKGLNPDFKNEEGKFLFR